MGCEFLLWGHEIFYLPKHTHMHKWDMQWPQILLLKTTLNFSWKFTPTKITCYTVCMYVLSYCHGLSWHTYITCTGIIGLLNTHYYVYQHTAHMLHGNRVWWCIQPNMCSMNTYTFTISYCIHQYSPPFTHVCKYIYIMYFRITSRRTISTLMTCDLARARARARDWKGSNIIRISWQEETINGTSSLQSHILTLTHPHT